jgi:hypothetical protein
VASVAEEGIEVRIHEETHDNSHCYRCVDASAAFAGAVYAQTTIATTSTTTTTSASNASSATWPLEPFLGPLLGQTQNKNLTSFCHKREVRHERVTWYKQLPTDQKNALHNDLKQAYSNGYNQLPQDQKDKLQSTLNQTS